ncbi:unnamed protein product, partial [Prorocentrum cordatum]
PWHAPPPQPFWLKPFWLGSARAQAERRCLGRGRWRSRWRSPCGRARHPTTAASPCGRPSRRAPAAPAARLRAAPPPPDVGRQELHTDNGMSELASTADGVLASIDSTLQVLQAASSRLENQLESQQEMFGLVMDAVSRRHSGATEHAPSDCPTPPRAASAGLRRASWRAAPKAATRSRTGCHGTTSAGNDWRGAKLNNSTPSPRAAAQPFRDPVEDETHGTCDGALNENLQVLIMDEDAKAAPPLTPTHPLSLPGVGRVMGSQRSGASQASHTCAESPPNPSSGGLTKKNKIFRGFSHRTLSSASVQTSPRYTVTSLYGVGNPSSDTARDPSGFWKGTRKSFGIVPSGDTPSTASFASRVNQVLAGKAEDVARSVILGNGGTLLDDEVSMPRFMLSPQSPVHVVLAILMIVGVVYTGLLSPIVLAYFHSDRVYPIWSIPMHFADALWLVFILVLFRSALHDQSGSVVVDARKIAAHYARTWLLMDLLSAWPAFLVPEGTAAYSACMVLKLLRAPRLAPLMSLLMKECRVYVLSPLKWGLMMLLLLHSMACFWRLMQCDIGLHVASGAGQEHPDTYCQGGDWWHAYVSDMYWVTMTLSTVGYGDIHPYNTMARVFAMFVMFLSPIFFGSVVAALSKVIDRLFDEKVESCVATMSQFMRRHSVPLGLQRKVERSLRQALGNEVNVAPLDPELFARLSPALQRTFSFAILSSTIGRFPLFRGAIHSFVAELAQAHMLVHCSAGDLVGEAGQLVEDLVFVVNGALVARFTASWADRLDVPIEEFVQAGEKPFARRTSQDDDFTPASTGSSGTDRQRILGKGAWFGESCLVSRQHVLTASLIAQGLSELAVLSEEEYSRVVKKYPAMAARHERLVEEMGGGTISLSDFSWAEQPSQRSAVWARSRK